MKIPFNLECVLALSLFISMGANAVAQKEKTVINENLIPFQNTQHKWGYLNAQTGKQVIAPKYDDADLFINGLAKVSNFNPNAKNIYAQSLIGIIDTSGKEIFPLQFTAIDSVDNQEGSEIPGLIQFSAENGKTGISRQDGTWLVPMGKYQKFKFYNAHQYLADDRFFYDDGKTYSVPKDYQIIDFYAESKLFEVKKWDLLMGIISWDGKIIVPADYLDISYFQGLKRFLGSRLKTLITPKNIKNIENILIQSSNPKVKNAIVVDLMNESGKKIASFSSQHQADADEKNHTMSYDHLEQMHYVSLKTGKEVQSPKTKTVGNYEIFSKEHYKGIKAKNGDVVIPAKFLNVEVATPDLIIVESPENYKYGILNKDGKQLVPFQFNSLEYMKNNRFRAENDGKYGVINGEGKIILDCKYQLGLYFNQYGLADAYAEGKQGVVDTLGKEIIPVIYKTLFNTKETEKTEDTYYEAEKDGKWGLLNRFGKTVVPFEYGFVSIRNEDFKRGWASIEDSTRNYRGLFNINTRITIPPSYDITEVYPDFLIVGKRVDNDYKYQLLTTGGMPLTGMVYGKMNYTYGYLSCQKDKLYGVLDTKGKTIVPFKYRYLWEKTPHLLLAQQGDDYFYINTEGKEFKMH